MAIRIAPNTLSKETKALIEDTPRRHRAIVDRVLQMPEVREALVKRAGRPPSGKVRVTMLLKPETIAKFKATGPGWQSRMSDFLDAAKV